MACDAATGGATTIAARLIEMLKNAAMATTRYCMRDRTMPVAILW